MCPSARTRNSIWSCLRDIAARFNRDFGKGEAVFPLPEPVIMPMAPASCPLKDGTAKMSKSDPSDNSRINLADDADTIARKIKKAKTDPEALPASTKELEGRPEAKNSGRHLCRPYQHQQPGRAG